MSDLVQRSPGWSLPQAAYTDADVFAADLDRVFAAHWLFAGHTGELDAAVLDPMSPAFAAAGFVPMSTSQSPGAGISAPKNTRPLQPGDAVGEPRVPVLHGRLPGELVEALVVAGWAHAQAVQDRVVLESGASRMGVLELEQPDVCVGQHVRHPVRCL